MEDKRKLYCPECSTEIEEEYIKKLKEAIVCKKCKAGVTDNNVVRV